MMPPTLRSDRLTLRPHRATDLAACLTLWSDPDVVRHIGGVPQDRQAVWFRLLRYAGMWSLLGYGMWVVEDRSSGVFLGEAGLLSAERGIAALENGSEAGWVFGPAAWGRGIATEAMTMVLDWADATMGTRTIRCLIEIDNAASAKVAAKLGFTPYAQAELGGKPVTIYDRPAVA